MKSSRFMISVAATLFVLLASAVAQTGSVRAKVPFAFTVEKLTMPAGDYRVSIEGARLLVSRIDGAGTAYVMTNAAGGAKKDTSPRLVFHRYGNYHFLSQAWITGGAYELFAAPAELEWVRTTKQEQEVVLAARSR